MIACFVANGFYEIVKLALGMSHQEYRLLIFRYMFLVAAGCYIAVGKWQQISKTKITILSVISIVVGVGFTWFLSYTNYVPKILSYWKGTSFVACLYLVPILGVLLSKAHFGFKPIEIVGKASFNIFLVQMIYYNFWEEMATLIPDMTLRLLFGIANCVFVGVLFYYVENRLTQYVIRKIEN